MDRYISIKQIADNIMTHPLLQDLSLERIINYTVDFMRILGVPKIFNEQTEKVKIDDWRGDLPCDYYKIIQVRDCRTNLCMRYSTDSFHHSYDDKQPEDITYKIQGMKIYTSFEKGEVEISYKAILVDEDGYPLIPDDSKFTNALELYIKKKYFTILFDLGKISQAILQNTQQEYAWAVGQAQNSLTIPSIDEMESLKNSWCTLVQRVNSHKYGFRSNSIQEKIRLH